MAYSRYDVKEVSILIDDSVNITGVGEDMVTGEKDEGFAAYNVGAQGDVCESIVNNGLGSISITVQRTCPQKNFLLGLQHRVEPFPIWVTNKSLNERFGGTLAKLKNLPELAHGTEAEDITFEFQVIDYTVEPIA